MKTNRMGGGGGGGGGNVKQLFAADDLSRRHFQMHFFLGALRVNNLYGLLQ